MSFLFFHTPSENTEMLQREVSDSTWKETNRRKQPLYQQTVAIDCGTAQQETNCHRKLKKKLYIYSTLSLEKTKDLYKALMQIFKKKRKKYTTIRKKIKIIGHLLRLG